MATWLCLVRGSEDMCLIRGPKDKTSQDKASEDGVAKAARGSLWLSCLQAFDHQDTKGGEHRVRDETEGEGSLWLSCLPAFNHQDTQCGEHRVRDETEGEGRVLWLSCLQAFDGVVAEESEEDAKRGGGLEGGVEGGVVEERKEGGGDGDVMGTEEDAGVDASSEHDDAEHGMRQGTAPQTPATPQTRATQQMLATHQTRATQQTRATPQTRAHQQTLGLLMSQNACTDAKTGPLGPLGGDADCVQFTLPTEREEIPGASAEDLRLLAEAEAEVGALEREVRVLKGDVSRDDLVRALVDSALRLRVCVCVCVCVCAHTFPSMAMCMHTYTCMHIHMYAHTYVQSGCTNTHTHTYTHTQTLSRTLQQSVSCMLSL